MSLLETDVPIRNVITTDPEQATALENDVRAKIVDILADEARTIDEIHQELQRRGEDKAETTVRHHVNVLKEADIVELARLEDAGGGTLKYYKSNTRVYSYELPESAESELDDAFEDVRKGLLAALEDAVADHGDDIEAAAAEMKPCEYCETQHYEEFVLRELVDRALTDLSERGALDDVVAE